MDCDILTTVLSWEERFILGLKKNIVKYNPNKVLLFTYNNPLTFDWKKENLQKSRKLLGSKLIEIQIDNLHPSKNWYTFKECFQEYCKSKKVLIDITTMTREAIWLSLYNCKLNNCITNYIYYKPQRYSSDWISRDPGRPRLLYKMSGIAQLGAPSLLLITGGYDIQRLDSLIYNFEPKKSIVLLQNSNEYRNKENFKLLKDLLNRKYKIGNVYEYDAFNVESSFEQILKELSTGENDNSLPFFDSYNVILNSLGAKTSAISLFKVWLKYPQVALSYIPSKEYNKEYSFGIGEAISGQVPF